MGVEEVVKRWRADFKYYCAVKSIEYDEGLDILGECYIRRIFEYFENDFHQRLRMDFEKQYEEKKAEMEEELKKGEFFKSIVDVLIESEKKDEQARASCKNFIWSNYRA